MNSNEMSCPIYFENHQYGGSMYQIENFTNMKFGQIRTVIINGKPYFAAVDICRGLYMSTDHLSQMVNEIAQDIYYSMYQDEIESNHVGCGEVAHPFKIGEPKLDECDEILAPRFKSGGLELNETSFNKEELYYIVDSEVPNTNRFGVVFTQTVKTIFISEPMLYMLMFKSRKREAVRFKVWLSVEILPCMRLIGRDKAVSLLNQEVNNIADQITDINNKCNTIINNQNGYASYFDNRFNDTNGRIDFNTVGLCRNDSVLDGKITDIASGLNFVFGGNK